MRSRGQLSRRSSRPGSSKHAAAHQRDPTYSAARSTSALARGADFVRQSDIDKVRYPELIMKLARQQGGSIATRDVENLLHLHRKQAYRQLIKLVQNGDLAPVGRGGGAHYEITEKGQERIGQ